MAKTIATAVLAVGLVRFALLAYAAPIKYGKVYSLSTPTGACAAEGDCSLIEFGHPIACNRKWVREWEMFCFVDPTDLESTERVDITVPTLIASYNWGTWCSAERYSDHLIRCNRDVPQSWELFNISRIPPQVNDTEWERGDLTLFTGDRINLISAQWNTACSTVKGVGFKLEGMFPTYHNSTWKDIFPNRIECNSYACGTAFRIDAVSPEKWCLPRSNAPKLVSEVPINYYESSEIAVASGAIGFGFVLRFCIGIIGLAAFLSGR